MPEADREVEKAPLSIARNSSIPALDFAEDMKVETESLRPIFNDNTNNAFDIIDKDKKQQSKNKKSLTKIQRFSLAKVGINLDKPYGQSPFADVALNRSR